MMALFSNPEKKNTRLQKGAVVFFFLPFLFFCPSVWSSPSWGGDKEDTGTAFKLTLQGLAAVGGLPPPPVWTPYYPAWWGWWWPGWSGPAPYFFPPYSAASSPYQSPSYQSQPPSLPSNYPPQIKPAGRLLIFTNPIDSEVHVDGVRLQQHPNLSYEVGLLSGPHHVDIRKEGFKAFSYKVEIPPGGGIVLPVELEKQ